jgi:hypothetical protein
MRNMMTDDNPSEKVAKLLIDDLTDFKLNAAYSAYSKAWVENPDEGVRLELNKAMLSLTENKTDYSTFYYEMNRLGKNESDGYSGRSRIQSQRKRDWRRSEAKKRRILRHKR